MGKALQIIIFLLVVSLSVIACREPEPPASQITAADVLGGDELGSDELTGFKRAYEIRDFTFPDDHIAHPGFRNEWWYFTGNLKTNTNERYGYQLTFFRVQTSSDLLPEKQSLEKMTRGESAWHGQQLWMAHAALTDISSGEHIALQRFSRSGPGLAGAQLNPLSIWLDDWAISSEDNSFPWHIKLDSDKFSLQLTVAPLKKVVLQGDQGLSQKSATPGNASYYYSYTRLQTTGQLTLDGQQKTVSGLSWFDREWSTSALDKNQSGWDWFSLQLDSGEELMFYQLRQRDGSSDPHSAGSWVDSIGNTRSINATQIKLKELRYWESAQGQAYSVAWRIDYPQAQRSWEVRAVVDDQLMDTAIQYWEGAVEVIDPGSKKVIGRGYLEMTRS